MLKLLHFKETLQNDMTFFQNLKILEFATVLAGPAVGAFFAELGAQVIKIEPPGGDVTRHWRLPTETTHSDTPAYFCAVNWGKQSVVIDLKTLQGQEQARELCRTADVVICNFKPGAARRLGLSYEALQAENPSMIYAHLSGYGSENPRAGYDAIVQAESGFMYLNGQEGSPPNKMPVALIDLLAAHQLKEAILVALLNQTQTQHGALIEVSLLQTALSSLANQATNWLMAAHAPQKMGTEHPNIVPYGHLAKTQDGSTLLLGVGTDTQFQSLCQLLGMPELAHDSRFQTNAARVQHREILRPLINTAFLSQTEEPLLSRMHAHNIPVGKIHSIPEALALPEAQDLLLEVAHFKGVRTVAFDIRGQSRVKLSPPPRLGEHTDVVLGG